MLSQSFSRSVTVIPMRLVALALLVSGSLLPLTSAGHAAEIRVLTAGAFRQVIVAMAAPFEAATGNTVIIENDTAGALMKKAQGGAAFDVIVLTPEGLEALGKQSIVQPASVVRLAKVGIGVAIKAGAALPDIATTAAFRQTLLEAQTVAMIDPASGGSSGIYLMQLFAKWGISDQLKPKLVLVQGGLVANRLVSGEATLAIHQISEIMAVKGVTLVGPIPAEIQSFTVYAGALSAHAKQPDAAKAFLAELTSPVAAAVLKAVGMEQAE